MCMADKVKFSINRKTGAKSILKDDFLKLWITMSENQPLKPRTIDYDHEGSTIDEDGIRVTGTYDFCMAVASRLTDLMDYEFADTRLGISFSETVCRETGRPMGTFRLAIQVHERGEQSVATNQRMKTMYRNGRDYLKKVLKFN